MHPSPEGFNTGPLDNDHNTGLQVEIKDVYPLVNNAKVVAEWENLFSSRYVFNNARPCSF